VLIGSFIHKMEQLGIEVELVGNLPWIYLHSVNGRRVSERFYGNHVFTAFFMSVKTRWSDRRRVFQKIREMLK
jgi:hypothetical protein